MQIIKLLLRDCNQIIVFVFVSSHWVSCGKETDLHSERRMSFTSGWILGACHVTVACETFFSLAIVFIYRMSQEEGTKLRESVPYVKIYQYNPKHLYPKLNGYGDNGQRKVWSSGGSTHCNLSADRVLHVWPRLPRQITEIPQPLQQYSATQLIM
jgi:hypothetical protein